MTRTGPAGLAVLLVIGSALAQDSPPPGAYQSICINARVQDLIGGPGKELVAECMDDSNNRVEAKIPLPCEGDIVAQNGRLSCHPGRNPFAPPPGSYQSACVDANMAGPILRARCNDANGNRVETVINVLNCRDRDISVSDAGQLVCE